MLRNFDTVELGKFCKTKDAGLIQTNGFGSVKNSFLKGRSLCLLGKIKFCLTKFFFAMSFNVDDVKNALVKLLANTKCFLSLLHEKKQCLSFSKTGHNLCKEHN